MKELGRSTQKMLTTKDRSSHVYHRCRAAGRNQQVEEHKHTHTRTYKQQKIFTILKQETENKIAQKQ